MTVGTSSSSNYSAPTQIQPSTGQSEDSYLKNSYTYSAFLGVASSTAPNGAQAFATYDSSGRVYTSQAVTGAVTTYTYSSSPLLPYTTTDTTNTHWAQTIEDGLGRTITQSAGFNLGNTSTLVSGSDTIYGPYACSPMGKMVQVSQPYGPAATKYDTTYAYDGLGRTVSISLPPISGTTSAGTTTYSYAGNWTTVTDPANNWKQIEKDVFGNIVAVVEPDPANPSAPPVKPSQTAANTLLTTYSYDIINHLTGVSMTRAGVTQNRVFNYNSKLQLYQTSNPESGSPTANGVYTYTYNPDGTLHTRVDPSNQTTTYTYDKYRHVTKVQHGGGTSQTLNYTYDQGTNGAGRLTAVSMGPITGGCNAFSEAYGYDPPGHTVSKSLSIAYSGCNQVSMLGKWTYDNEGKLSTVAYPGANYATYGPTVNYTYDNMSRLTGASDSEGNSTAQCGFTPPGGTVTWAQSAAYTAAGQLGSLTRLYGGSASCSGLSTSSFGEVWYFNNLNQTTEIDVSGDQNITSPYLARYYYNAAADNGQIASMDDGRLKYSISYQYDALKRLITATATGQWSQSFTYDGFGNLTGKTVPSGSSEPAFPGVNSAKNWLNGVTYDANGNTISGLNSQTLSYDMENRMIQSQSGSATTNYAYDENNHRIEKTNGVANPVVYFYDPAGKLLASFSATTLGPQQPNYRIYFGGMLLGTSDGSGGDGSALADRLGTYNPGYPYGTDAGLYGVPGDDALYFATYTRDSATKFEYANNRYYSAGYGRFLTPDFSNKGQFVAIPQSWNLNAYALGDPINNNDPTGLCSYDDRGDYYDDDDHDTVAFTGACQAGIIGEGAQSVNALDINVSAGVLYVDGKPIGEQGLQEDIGTELGLASLLKSLFSTKVGAAELSEFANTGSVWSLNQFLRGTLVGEMLGENLPVNFPGIDIFANGVATSIKSVNLDAVSYQTTSGLQSALMSNVNKLINFMGDLESQGAVSSGGKTVTWGSVSNWVINIAIPNAPSAAQQTAIAAATDYAALNGIQLITTVVP